MSYTVSSGFPPFLRKSFKLSRVKTYGSTLLIVASLSVSSTIAGNSNTISSASQFYGKGEYKQAITIYNKIIRRHSSDSREAMYQKGHCLRSLNKFDEAIECWEKQLRVYQSIIHNDKTVLSIAATYGFSIQSFGIATEKYEEFFRKYSRSPLLPEAKYQYAGIFLLQHQYEKALPLFRNFCRRWPKSAFVSKANEQIVTCESIIQKAAVEEIALQKRRKAQNKLERERKKWPKSKLLLIEAEKLFLAGKFQEARPIYQNITCGFTSREHEKAWYRLGKCYQHQGKYRQAIAAWRKTCHVPAMFASGQYNDDALVATGDIFFDDINDIKTALKYYQSVLEKYPATDLKTHIYSQMATALIIEGETEKAIVLLKKALANKKDNPDMPLTGLERLLQSCENPNAFLLSDAQQKNARVIANKMRRADIYFTAKNYTKAADIYGQIVKKVAGTEDAAYALMQAGRCHNMCREHKKALKNYRNFLHRYKNSKWADDALLRAGVIYVGPLNQAEKGRKLFELILEQHPNSDEAPTAHMHLATLSMWDENWEKTEKLHKTFLINYPDNKYVEFIKQIRLPEIEKQLKEKNKQKADKT